MPLEMLIDYNAPFTNDVCLTLYNIKKHCPPFARCCDRSMNVEVHLEIKYCPICGKELQKAREE